jgi:hypothetical protein
VGGGDEREEGVEAGASVPQQCARGRRTGEDSGGDERDGGGGGERTSVARAGVADRRGRQWAAEVMRGRGGGGWGERTSAVRARAADLRRRWSARVAVEPEPRPDSPLESSSTTKFLRRAGTTVHVSHWRVRCVNLFRRRSANRMWEQNAGAAGGLRQRAPTAAGRRVVQHFQLLLQELAAPEWSPGRVEGQHQMY